MSSYDDDDDDFSLEDGLEGEEVCDTILSRELGRYGRVKVTSDLPTMKHRIQNYSLKKAVKVKTSKRPTTKLGGASFSAAGFMDAVDNFDRSPNSSSDTVYADSGTYAMSGGKDKAGERLPKIGAYAYAGVAQANAEYSIFQANARALHAGAQASVSVNELGASAMATAELASASANAGPLGVKVGLAADTGAKVGVDGVELKVLGTGFSVGPKTSVALLGSEVSCAVM